MLLLWMSAHVWEMAGSTVTGVQQGWHWSLGMSWILSIPPADRYYMLTQLYMDGECFRYTSPRLTQGNGEDLMLSTWNKYMIGRVTKKGICTIYVIGNEKKYLQPLLASHMTGLHWIWLNNAFQDSTCWRAIARSVSVNAHRNNLGSRTYNEADLYQTLVTIVG